jgi:hypothetical protein
LLSYSDCSNGIGFGCTSSPDSHGKKGAIKFAKQVQLDGDSGKASDGLSEGYPRQKLRSWTKARVIPKNKGMPGELGKAVAIPPDKEEEKKEKFKINQFNLMASDMISLNRSLQDVRMSQCKSKVRVELFANSFFSLTVLSQTGIGTVGVANPDHFDTDQDPTFHFDTTLDPDPDPPDEKKI